MTRYIATTQQGHVVENHMEELTVGIQGIASEFFGNDPINSEVRWKVIPKGFGFTAGQLSSSTVLLCIVPDELEYSTRVEFMKRINAFWVKETGIDSNKLAIFTTSIPL